VCKEQTKSLHISASLCLRLWLAGVHLGVFTQVVEETPGRKNHVATDDHLPLFIQSSHLVGAADLRVGHAAYYEDDQARAWTLLLLLFVIPVPCWTGTIQKIWLVNSMIGNIQLQENESFYFNWYDLACNVL